MEKLSDINKEETIRMLIKQMKGFSTPELCDGAGDIRINMNWQIRPWIGEGRICGPAVTVEVPDGEGGIVADAILELKEGEVLVVAGKGNCSCSYWGDHRSICASMRKGAGVVIDGGFRDVEGCEEAGFPVFARGLTCRTAGKTGEGAINVPVYCGELKVNPGDLIVGDRNGVVVIPPQKAEEIMKRALDKRRRQEAVIRKMRETREAIPRIPK